MQWDDISYLAVGTSGQRQAYQILVDLKIFDVLAGYNPILVGTIPLDIEVEGSDLDIICEVYDLSQFEALLQAQFSAWPDFSLRHRQHNNLPVVVCNFTVSDFPVEIFGQPRPVKAQHAYRHMVAEARLLSLAGRMATTGEAAKTAIRRLKAEGLKTEPAFGQYFVLPGDPYETLLTLAEAAEERLYKIIEQAQVIKAGCIFCQIVAGKTEASVVYKDAQTMALMNLRQANPGHVLVIPRRHVEQVYDLDDRLAAHLMQTVVLVSRAVKQAVKAEGLNVWQSNGEQAGQEIPHFHFHLFPRQANDGYFSVYPELPPFAARTRLEALAAKIKEGLSG